MRKILTSIGLATFVSTLAMAEAWSGHLIDAKCYDEHKKSDSCAATNSTTQFMLEASGKFFKLDEAGNSKAAAALKNRADRSADPGNPPKKVSAKITGTEKDGTITVEAVDVQ